MWCKALTFGLLTFDFHPRGGSISSEGLRRRRSSDQKESTPPQQEHAKGEKLIEAEKAETGSVSHQSIFTAYEHISTKYPYCLS